MGKNQHVTKHKDGWQVIGAGNKKATKVMPTQRKAIETAMDIAKKEKSEVVIHSKDGGIRQKNSYGNDPHPPRG